MVSQKTIVNTIAMILLFLLKSIDIKWPKIAPANDITITMIALVGVL